MSIRRKGRRLAFLTGVVLVAGLATGAWLVRDHVMFLLRFESLGRSAQGLQEYRHRRTGIVMVRIPGGTFVMGSPEAAYTRTSEQHRHEVTLSPFLLSKYEVTQSEWLRIWSANPSRVKGDDMPVHGVTWMECREFCRRAGLSLPTEAQWEYACRAGDRSPVHAPRPYFDGRFGGVFGSGGERLDGMTPEKLSEFTRELDRVAWFADNSGDRPHPVGGKEPNELGLHDMLGNVSELCIDAYDRDFYSRPEAAGRDPVCTVGTEDRVLRGGSFWSKTGLQMYRSTARFPWSEDSDASPIGFLGLRVAYPLPR